MDQYLPPQDNLPSLHISSPRSLRPRDHRDAQLETPLRRYEPQPTRPPVIPVLLSQGRPATDQGDLDMDSNAPSDVESSMASTSPPSPARRFVGGFVSGLQRIPHAMMKRHSRDASLYDEYVAQETVSRPVSSRYLYPSTVLSDISEHSMDTDGLQRARTAESHPVGRPLDQIMQTGVGIGSPTNTNSGLTSQSPRDEPVGPVLMPPRGTWAYYIRHIQLFLLHIWMLPWYSPRIVNDYVPARDGRGQYGAYKPRVPWYLPRGAAPYTDEKWQPPEPTLPEFLVVPPTPTSGSQLVGSPGLVYPRFALGGDGSVNSSGVATAIRPLGTPGTATSAGYGFPSPGASSHGQRRHSASLSWYFPSPPPIQPFQSFSGQHFSEFTSPSGYTRTISPGLSP